MEDENKGHEHECQDRDDAICSERGYCVCACGVRCKWEGSVNWRGNPWEVPADADVATA